MKKGIVIIILMVLLCVLMLCVSCKNKETKISKELPEALRVETGGVKIDFAILPDIEKAQEILEQQDAGYYVKEEERVAKTETKNKSKIKARGKIQKAKKPKTKTRRWKVQKLEDYNVLLAVENIKDKNRKLNFPGPMASTLSLKLLIRMGMWS
jgi:hypothetical protein